MGEGAVYLFEGVREPESEARREGERQGARVSLGAEEGEQGAQGDQLLTGQALKLNQRKLKAIYGLLSG